MMKYNTFNVQYEWRWPSGSKWRKYFTLGQWLFREGENDDEYDFFIGSLVMETESLQMAGNNVIMKLMGQTAKFLHRMQQVLCRIYNGGISMSLCLFWQIRIWSYDRHQWIWDREIYVFCSHFNLMYLASQRRQINILNISFKVFETNTWSPINTDQLYCVENAIFHRPSYRVVLQVACYSMSRPHKNIKEII